MTRRTVRLVVLTTTAVTVLGLVVVNGTAVAAPGASGAGEQVTEQPSRPGPAYLVGRGVGDVTGEVVESGMAGGADTDRVTSGLHMRQRARAFVVVDRASDRRVVHVTAEVGMIHQSVRDAVLLRLQRRFGPAYGESNVMLTATHTHSAPGGTSHHDLDNLSSLGFHDKTFRATVDGIVDAVVAAEEDLSPSDLWVSRSELVGVGVTSVPEAFDRNPTSERKRFPTGVDTTSTTLHVERRGTAVGALSWLGVHPTGLGAENTLVSGDSTGYAAWFTEDELHGVDHTADRVPAFVAAYAQSTSGEVAHVPVTSSSDGFDVVRAVGERLVQSVTAPAPRTPVAGPVDSRIVYVDLADTVVDGAFTPDGRRRRTCPAALGTAFATGAPAGSGGLPRPTPEQAEGNPVATLVSEKLRTASPSLKKCQAPKKVLLAAGGLDLVQQKLPVQLLRVGQLHLVGVPGEVSTAAGLRLRREVARTVDVDVDDVLVQGYANAYAHHVTTPEEYDAGGYRAAATLFGRHQLPALQQTLHRLAEHMVAGTRPARGAKERDRSALRHRAPRRGLIGDVPQDAHAFGDVLKAPRARYDRGELVEVTFVGAHLNNNLRRRDTYLAVERKVGGAWRRVADDADFSTRLTWQRDGRRASKVTVAWQVPDDTEPGTYRVRHFGDARSIFGTVRSFTGASTAFEVR